MRRWVLMSLFSFPLMVLLVIGIIFLISSPSQPEGKKQSAEPVQKRAEVKKEVKEDLRRGNWTKIKNTIDSLYTLVDKYRDSLKIKGRVIDSLATEMATFDKKRNELVSEIEKWKKKYTTLTQKQDKVREIAKTISALKAKDMAKIVSKLDDQTIIQIYDQMSKTSRKNLLAALSSDRAAAITQKMIKN